MRFFVSTLGCCFLCGFAFAGPETVLEVDGSNDHRIFRVGSATRLMLEPVLWKLIDTDAVRLSSPITSCLKTPLPPEYADYSLWDLYYGRIALPDEFPEVCADPRASFFAGLWSITTRVNLTFGKRRPSKSAIALMWIAISEKLGMTPDELCEEYLVRPYGLKDTSFRVVDARKNRMLVPVDERLSCSRLYSEGLLSSPSDVLRVAYVIRPLLARAKVSLETTSLLNGCKVTYLVDSYPEGSVFIGFDCISNHAIVRLSTSSEISLPEMFLQMESLGDPQDWGESVL